MRERDLVAHLVAWLESDGWSVQTEVAYLDVLATREDEVLKIEAKGHTSSKGLDVDTMFGQMLRHIDPGQSDTRYGVAVPVDYLPTIRRIDRRVLEQLSIDVFLVDDDGRVQTA